VTNSGLAPLHITNVAAGGDFAATGTCLGATLEAGLSCTISVTFTPTIAGTRLGTVTITDDAGSVPGSVQTVPLTGTGTQPAVTITPYDNWAFGSQLLNTTSAPPKTFILTNSGHGPLTFTISAHGDFAQTNDCISPLDDGQSCTISVTFTPTALGLRNGTVVISDNAPGNPHSITLSGTGTAPAVGLAPTSLVFGNQLVGTTSSPPLAVTVTNTGTSPLHISAAAASGEFSVAAGQTCIGATVDPGNTCTILVVFWPTAVGARSGTLTVTDDAGNVAGTTQPVPLTGTGVAPAATVSPASVDFGNQLVGTTSVPQTVTLTNVGSSILNIADIAASGDFALGTSTCATTLASLASCTTMVTFHPTATGTRSGALTFTDDAGNVPGTVQTVTLTGTGGAGTATLSPTSVNFGSQLVGTTSATQNVTLTNNGASTLNIASITVTTDFGVGAEASDFRILQGTCGATLAADSSCTFGVTFTPSARGARTGRVVVTDDAGNVAGTQQTVALTGTGIAPVAALSPATVDFGSVNVGTTSDASTVTLTNNGDSPLHLTDIVASGDFALGTTTCQAGAAGHLEPAASCYVTVTFSPRAIGTRTGTLTFTDDSVSGPEQTVPLTGGGRGFAFSLAPGSSSVQTMAAGGTAANFNIVATGGAGFAESVSFTCSDLNHNKTILCQVTPGSYTFGTSVNLTVIVGTTKRVLGAPLAAPRMPVGGLGILSGQAFMLLLMMLIAMVGLRKRRAWVLLAATLLFVAMLAACGGGGAAPYYPPGTPAGTYTILVTGTAAGGTSVTMPLTLIVT